MTTDKKNISHYGSFILPVCFIVLAIFTFYDTLSFGDLESKVFPRVAAVALLLGSIAILVLQILKFVASEEGFTFDIRSGLRQYLLIASMLLFAAAVAHVSFLLAGGISYAGALISAKHGRWSVREAVVYGVSGVLILVGFYVLFQYGLDVPLDSF